MINRNSIGKNVTVMALAITLLLSSSPLGALAQDQSNGQLLDHSMTSGVDASTNYATQRTNVFSSTDSRAYSWLELGNVGAGTVKWTWYSPDGNVYYNGKVNIPQPNGAVWDKYFVWNHISIDGHNAANQPGDWHVDVYLDNQQILTEQFSITSETGSSPVTATGSSYGRPETSILDDAMASSIDESTSNVGTRTNDFSTTDSKAYSWFSLANVGNSKAEWIWYSPDGNSYYTYDSQIPQPSGDYWETYNLYSSMDIAGSDAANLPGNWHVDIYLDGQQILTEQFTITSPKYRKIHTGCIADHTIWRRRTSTPKAYWISSTTRINRTFLRDD